MVGKPATPSPVGQWHVINKKIITHPSVFGTRWMGLNNPGYGIHGTNNPSSIGTAASLGCIRMHNHHVEELFPQISLNTPVIIHNGTRPQTLPIADDVSYEPEVVVTPEQPEGNNHFPKNNNSYELTSQPTPNSSRTYIVKSGDTFWNIAKKLNIPLNELVKANMHLNPNNLQIGQKINLP